MFCYSTLKHFVKKRENRLNELIQVQVRIPLTAYVCITFHKIL